MREHRDSGREVSEVVRLLAPLTGARASVPSSDVVYWRARVRLALDETSLRRRRALRPMRLFQVATGAGSIGLAAAVSVWPLFVRTSPGRAGLLALPLLLAMVAAGAYLLAEAGYMRAQTWPTVRSPR